MMQAFNQERLIITGWTVLGLSKKIVSVTWKHQTISKHYKQYWYGKLKNASICVCFGWNDKNVVFVIRIHKNYDNNGASIGK